MKFDAYESFEVWAEAFRIMTGHMAPGKDQAAAACLDNCDERQAAFSEWIAVHGDAVSAAIRAVEKIVRREEDADSDE